MPRRMLPSDVKDSKYGARKKADQLTLSQKLFAEELIADPLMSPREAAVKAGYSPHSAESQGSQLLRHPVIAQMLSKAMNDRLRKTEVKKEEVLNYLYCALTLDPLDLFDQDVDGSLSFKQLQEVPVQIRRLITKLEVKTRPVGTDGSTESRVKIEWVSKELVLQLVMKHIGMLSPESPVSSNLNVNVNVQNVLIQQLRESLANASGRVIDTNAIEELAKESAGTNELN